MSGSKEISQALDETIDTLNTQIGTSMERAVELHRHGADENVVLAETAVAVGAAKALERLTGASWEEAVQAKGAEYLATGGTEAPAGGRRRRWWLRKQR